MNKVKRILASLTVLAAFLLCANVFCGANIPIWVGLLLWVVGLMVPDRASRNVN